MKNISKLIINSPYQEPEKYWSYKRETREFILKKGRRLAGYVTASDSSKSEINEELTEGYKGTISLPFETGKYSRVAIKIVDDRGIESLKVIDL
jgi:hypothetical protein